MNFLLTITFFIFIDRGYFDLKLAIDIYDFLIYLDSQ